MNDSSKRAYKICASCIMDTSDSNITFDSRGWCDYCNNFHQNILPNWHPDARGEREMLAVAKTIRNEGRDREHDCIIGVSGGVDSSYVAMLAKEKLELRPLIFHVDAGWNSQQSVNNIEKMVDGLGLDLHTEVIDWQEMKDLQLAFIKAQVPHLDTPQDHAFFAALYNFAASHGFKYVITGANYSTECVREPLEWHYHATDLRQLKDIHARFGTRPLKTFPLTDIFTHKLYHRFVKGMRIVKPLNNFPYIKEEAMQELADRFGWQKYAHKHYESRFTRFYEGYWLPVKFGYDKRRAHFSSLILTGQLSRDEALRRIARPAYDEETMAHEFEYVATKLDLTVAELRALMNGPNKSYRNYKSSMPLINLGTKVLRALGVQKDDGAMIAIVDYGLGNIAAFASVYNRANIKVSVARTAADLKGASKLVLPGVGHFDHAMRLLQESGMRAALDEMVLGDKVPVIGVCVGMQILARSSEEGSLPGLGWIDGEVRAFKSNEATSNLPVPHMGWNDVRPLLQGKLFDELHDKARFYFLHSYYMSCDRDEDALATCSYGTEFVCAVQSSNIYGVQFHPEKSHGFGNRLLRNFAEL